MSVIHDNRDIIEKFSGDSTDWCENEFRPVFADLVDHLIADICGFAYCRAGIDIKTRHLVSLAILSSMGDCNDQLKFQLGAGLRIGLSGEEIKEVFIQVAVFAGNARAINAARIFHEIIKTNKTTVS